MVLDGDVDGSEQVLAAWADRVPVRAVVFPGQPRPAGSPQRRPRRREGRRPGPLRRRPGSRPRLRPAPRRRPRSRVQRGWSGCAATCSRRRRTRASTAARRTSGSVPVRTPPRPTRAGATGAATSRSTASTWDRVGPYDEGYRGYGWEDVDWGYRVHSAGVPDHGRPRARDRPPHRRHHDRRPRAARLLLRVRPAPLRGQARLPGGGPGRAATLGTWPSARPRDCSASGASAGPAGPSTGWPTACRAGSPRRPSRSPWRQVPSRATAAATPGRRSEMDNTRRNRWPNPRRHRHLPGSWLVSFRNADRRGRISRGPRGGASRSFGGNTSHDVARQRRPQDGAYAAVTFGAPDPARRRDRRLRPAGVRCVRRDDRPAGADVLRPARRRRRLRERGRRPAARRLGRDAARRRRLRPRHLRGRHRGVQAGPQGLAAQLCPGRYRLLPHRLPALSRLLPAGVHDRDAAAPGVALRVPPLDPAHPPPRPPAPGRDHRRQRPPHRRGRRGAAPRVVARLHRARRADHRRPARSSRPRPASPSSARPPTPPPPSTASAPTSSSSPTARSPAPTTCAARCGTSRAHTVQCDRGPEPHRRLQRAPQGPPGRRTAARPRRRPAHAARLSLGQARLRRRRLARSSCC